MRPFMNYLVSRFLYIHKKQLFNVYVTDALKVIAENTSGLSKQGSVMNKRYADLIRKETNNDVNSDKKAEEIINKLKEKLKEL